MVVSTRVSLRKIKSMDRGKRFTIRILKLNLTLENGKMTLKMGKVRGLIEMEANM